MQAEILAGPSRPVCCFEPDFSSYLLILVRLLSVLFSFVNCGNTYCSANVIKCIYEKTIRNNEIDTAVLLELFQHIDWYAVNLFQ